ncbi:MAG: TldD/PmbA family protein [Candidatus Micrarchaeota archaeon]
MAFDFDRFARKLERYEYAEAVLSRTAYASAILKDGNVDSAKEGGEENLAVRVYAGGASGFSVTNQLEKAGEALRRAETLARARKGNARLAKPEVHDADSVLRPKKDALHEPMEEKIARLKEYSREARKGKVFRVQATLTAAEFEKFFANSAGSRVDTFEPRIVCTVHAFAKDGGRTESSFHQMKARAGAEALEEMHAKAGEAAGEANLLLKAGEGPKGRMTAVLDSELAGVMAHEAVGHACEADEVQAGGSILKGRLGRRIGAGAVDIMDSPALEPRLWGSYEYDDEGTKARGTALMERGVLKSFLTSLETATENRGRLTGNARAEPGRRPLVRMTNTHFGRGDAEVDELFQGVRKGVYLVGCKEGQVSPKSGNFTFAAKYGYVIENGERKRLFKDCSINGNIFDALHEVSLVASDLAFTPGTCGKESQGVPVTTGSPHLLIKNILVG